jgi:hypothetical protein
MQMSFDDDDEISVKMLDTRTYIRLKDGTPQVVRVVPVVNELGLFNKEMVAVYVDEGKPNFVSRSALENMLSTSECIPIEEATQWKHQQIH